MIYLVRHGQTDWNLTKKIQGQKDISLNETGREQAKLLTQNIFDLKIDKIISSDLLRAQETAEIINEIFNKKIYLDKRLREINYGLIEGTASKDIPQDVWDTFNNYPAKINAESMTEVFNRVKSFFESLSDLDEDILIVTHGGVFRMVMYYIDNNLKFDKEIYLDYKNEKINNTDIFVMEKEKIYKMPILRKK